MAILPITLDLGGSIISEVLLAALMLLLLYVVLKFSKLIFKVLFGIIINSILGIIAIFGVNYFLGIGIAITTPILIVTALFGLPAVFILVILKMFKVIA